MARHKIIITWITMVVFAGLLVSPALAHQRYRYHPKGLPRRAVQHHTHPQPVEFVTTAQPEAAKFDILKVPFDLVAGLWKAVVGPTEDKEPVVRTKPRRRYHHKRGWIKRR